MKRVSYPLRKTMCACAAGFVLLILACSNKDSDESNSGNKGYVTGAITDTQGKPIAGAEVVIDNTMIYNSNLLANSDAAGKYKVKLNGHFTWSASATFSKNYNGKNYKFHLQPDNNDGFTSDGAVRNFSWKLTGQRPESNTSFYGSWIQLQSEIGSDILAENVDFILTPDGPLVDGSTGQTITKRGGAPQTYSYFKLMDIPLGRYKVKARYQGNYLTLKNLINNESGTEITLNFEPEIVLTGLVCDNCAVIEYKS
ncbi:carboxypeptidase-like regulatory domain-containing protein [Pseudoflavitalea rhizosphaerae]|uniref:carboxypeptidase-like regulatory domain-containing protein n=1 Tax=Pseudoflavitalea rhizosphaerae TaxID=1884793 RepID=UPI000F8D3DBB|nr:carboxypeptidase-like regulatory domain-containing protein [Pseudoflavitalea rhizosphaerae]